MGKLKKCAALVLCAVAVAAFGQTELLTNPGFDGDGAPWKVAHTAGQTWVDVAGLYSVSGGEAHLATNGNGTFTVFQRVDLAAGATYTYTMDYDVTAAFAANNGAIDLVLVPGSDVDDDGDPATPAVTLDWDGRTLSIDSVNAWGTGQEIPLGVGQFTGEFTAPGSGGAATPFAIVFTLQCWAGSGGSIDIDQISIMGDPVGGDGDGDGDGSGFTGGFAEAGSTIEMCAPDGGTGYVWSYSGPGDVSEGGILTQNSDFGAATGWQTVVDSWAGSTVDFNNGTFNIHHGGQANVGVYQVVTLETGVQYDVSFDYELTSAADNFGIELLAIDPLMETVPPAGDWTPYRLNGVGNWGTPVTTFGPDTMTGSYTAPGNIGDGTVDIAFLAIWYSWSSPQAFEGTFDNFEVGEPGADPGVPGMPLGFTGDVNSQCLTLEDITEDYTGTYTCNYDDGSKAPQVYTVQVDVVESLPVTGAIGLGILAGASLLSGTIALRRRKK